jgi:hypothetical protein
MSVDASFYVAEIIKNNTEYVRVKLLPTMKNVSKNPHTSANPDGTYESPNVEWSKYTPSGELWMNVSTETGAVKFFEDALANHEDIPLTFG